MAYKLKRNGTTYEFGHSIHQVGEGDFVEVSGRIEQIKSIKLKGWDREITTESGTYAREQIKSYGKKV